jgi:hypothetical protein
VPLRHNALNPHKVHNSVADKRDPHQAQSKILLGYCSQLCLVEVHVQSCATLGLVVLALY